MCEICDDKMDVNLECSLKWTEENMSVEFASCDWCNIIVNGGLGN